MKKHTTREAWLVAGIDKLRPLFKAQKYAVPKNVRVTCGFPSRSALARVHQRIGECWSDKNSEGKVFEIFITPVIAASDRVLDILVHELVHATVGLKAKHGSAFKRCATAVGLEGRMTATHAGKALAATLAGIIKAIGPYPHAKLKSFTNGDKKQTTRLLKAVCEECGYTVRVTQKWLDEAGAPLCPTDEKPLTV